MIKVGQRARCKWGTPHTNLSGVFPHGNMATITEIEGGGCFRVKFDDPTIQKVCVAACGSPGYRWRTDHWDFVTEPPLDLSLPVKCRNGDQVAVTVADDKDRPYRATISGLELSFDTYGNFVPGQECPIDLVNT